VSITVLPDATIASLKSSILQKLKERLDDTAIGCMKLEDADWGISSLVVDQDEHIDESVLIKDNVPVSKAGFKNEGNGVVLCHLINLSGKEPCTTTHPTTVARVVKEKMALEREKKKDKKEHPKDPFGSIVVKDLDGKDVVLSNHWLKTRCVVTLIRRFG